MSTTLQIFDDPQFEDDIVKEESHTYKPNVPNYNYSDEVEIVINQQDALLSLFDGELYIDLNFVPEDNTCKLTDNFAAFLFETISYELNGVEVERIRDPGIITTLKTYLCYNEMEAKTLTTVGWYLKDSEPIKTPTNLSVCLPLKYLFSVFMDYRKVLLGKHRFRLTRSRNDNNCYVSSSEKKASIVVNSIELKVKHVYVNDNVKLEMLKKIEKNIPIIIPFRKWEIYELPTLHNSNKEIWGLKSYVDVEKPRFIVVAFQHNRKNNVKKDITYFDNVNIQNLKLHLNSSYFPYENMNIDFSKKKYVEPYLNYTRFKSNFLETDESAQPYLSYEDFAEKALFYINCSRQDETLRASTVDVKLEIEAHANFNSNTSAFCLIIHDSMIRTYPLTNIVQNII